MKKSVILKFPSQFSSYINNEKTAEFDGDKIADLLEHLEDTFGNVKERIMEDDGKLRPYINFFVGAKNIKDKEGLNTLIENGDKITLLLSRAGG
jgi:molybdopterin converting factor small subunit